MKKRIVSSVLAFCFVLGVAGTGMAAKVKCTVESVDGEKVILNCGKKADKFKAGDELKVPTAKKKGGAATEGC